jgi:hypothetical protein
VKRSEIRKLVLETMLEYERAQETAEKGKGKKAKKAKKPRAEAPATKPIDLPYFLSSRKLDDAIAHAGTRLTPAKRNINRSRSRARRRVSSPRACRRWRRTAQWAER